MRIKIQHLLLPKVWILPPYFHLLGLYIHIHDGIRFFQVTADLYVKYASYVKTK
jgi:hypothetical protein